MTLKQNTNALHVDMSFSFDTVESFERHIENSIPAYSEMIDAVVSLASYFVRENSFVFDLGCSTGSLLNKIANNHAGKIQFTGFDISDNLISQSNSKDKRIKLKNKDITKGFAMENEISSLILSVFTMQFLSIQDRKKIIHLVYETLLEGGAFIFTEKIFMDDGVLSDAKLIKNILTSPKNGFLRQIDNNNYFKMQKIQ